MFSVHYLVSSLEIARVIFHMEKPNLVRKCQFFGENDNYLKINNMYSIAAFEESSDIHTYDPLKTSFEYAKEARSLAGQFQDFNTEYLKIASKCEDFSKELLDKCTTKHEVQTLLQTKVITD